MVMQKCNTVNKSSFNCYVNKKEYNYHKLNSRLLKNGSFNQQIDKYIDKALPSSELLYLGKTPKILQKIGLENHMVIMTQSALKHITMHGKENSNNHGIEFETIKKIPMAIINPLTIIYSSSSSKGNSVVIVTSLFDNYKRPIIVSILLNEQKQIGNIKFTTNMVTSIYGKRDYGTYIYRETKKGNVLYNSEDGIIKELAHTGVRFSESPNSINNNIPNSN